MKYFLNSNSHFHGLVSTYIIVHLRPSIDFFIEDILKTIKRAQFCEKAIAKTILVVLAFRSTVFFIFSTTMYVMVMLHYHWLNIQPVMRKAIKVQTFWETHKIWKNLPHGFDKSADLLSKHQNHEEDFFKLSLLLKKFELYSRKPMLRKVRKT